MPIYIPPRGGSSSTDDLTGSFYTQAQSDARFVHLFGDEIIAGSKTLVDDLLVDANVEITGFIAENVRIEDNVITLNYGEPGSGITLGTAGLEIDRGTANDAYLVLAENASGSDSDNRWMLDIGDGNMKKVLYDDFPDTAIFLGDLRTDSDFYITSLTPANSGNFLTWDASGKLVDSGFADSSFVAADQQFASVVTGITADANFYNAADGNFYSDAGYTTLATDNTAVIQDAVDACPAGCNLVIPSGNIGVEDTILIDKNIRLVVFGDMKVQGGFKPSTLLWYSEGKVRADLFQVRADDVTVESYGSHYMNQEWAGTYTTGDTVDVIDDAGNLSGENGNQIYLNVVSAVGTPVFSGTTITSYSGCDNFKCKGIRAEKTFNGVMIYASSDFFVQDTNTLNAPTHDTNYTNAAVELKFCDTGTINNTIGEGTEEAIDFNPNAREISVDGVIGIDCTQACVELNNAFNVSVSNVQATNCFNGLRLQNYETGRNPAATYQNEGISISNVSVNYDDEYRSFPSMTNAKAVDIRGCNTVAITNLLINMRVIAGLEAENAIHIHNVGTASAQRRSRRINMDGFIVRTAYVDAIQDNGTWVLVEGDTDQVHMSNGLFELVGIENGQTVIEVSDANGGACDDIQFRDIEIRGSAGQPNTTGFLTDNNSTVDIIHPSFKDVNTPTNLGTNTTYVPLLSDHNDLGNIQGGTTDEYYHLTAAEYSDYIGSSEVSTLIDGISGDYVNVTGDTMTGNLSIESADALNPSLNIQAYATDDKFIDGVCTLGNTVFEVKVGSISGGEMALYGNCGMNTRWAVTQDKVISNINNEINGDGGSSEAALKITKAFPVDHPITDFEGDKGEVLQVRNKDFRHYLAWDGNNNFHLGKDSSEFHFGEGAPWNASYIWKYDTDDGDFVFGSGYPVKVSDDFYITSLTPANSGNFLTWDQTGKLVDGGTVDASSFSYSPAQPTFYGNVGFGLSTSPTTVEEGLDSNSYLGAVAFQTSRNISSTTLLTGGELSVASSTQINISGGQGFIIDHETLSGPFGGAAQGTLVSWDNMTVTVPNLTGGYFSLVSIDINGDPVFSQNAPDTETYRDELFLGKVIHRGGSIQFVSQVTQFATDYYSQMTDLALAIGPMNLEGNVYYEHDTATLELSKTAGESFRWNSNSRIDRTNPHHTMEVAQDPISDFFRVYRDGSGGWTYESGQTEINPENYDNGSGTLATVGSTFFGRQYSVQRIYMFPRSGRTYVFYGQDDYTTFDNALEGITTEDWEGPPDNFYDASFRGWLIVRGGITDFSNPNNFRFIPAGKFGGSSGGGASTSQTTFTDAEFALYNNGFTDRTLTFDLSDLTPAGEDIVISANDAQVGDIDIKLPSETGTLALVGDSNAGFVLDTGDTMTGQLNVPDITVSSLTPANSGNFLTWDASGKLVDSGENASTLVDDLSGSFVLKSGDTMTGNLAVETTGTPAGIYTERTDGSMGALGAGSTNTFIRYDNTGGFTIQSQPRVDLEAQNGLNLTNTFEIDSAGDVTIHNDATINDHCIIDTTGVHVSDNGTNSTSDAGVHIHGSNQNGAGTAGGIVFTQQSIGNRRLYFTGNDGGYTFNFGSYDNSSGDFQLSDGQVSVAAEFRLGPTGQRVMRNNDSQCGFAMEVDDDLALHDADTDTDAYHTYMRTQDGGPLSVASGTDGGNLYLTLGSGIGDGVDGRFVLRSANSTQNSNMVEGYTAVTSAGQVLDTFTHDSTFGSAEWLVSLNDGTVTRSSKVVATFNSTSVDYTEYGIVEIGGSYTGATLSVANNGASHELLLTVTSGTHNVKVSGRVLK